MQYRYTKAAVIVTACLCIPIPAYAARPADTAPAETVLSPEESKAVEEYLKVLDEPLEDSLTAEESEAGYQLIDGHKYSPEELAGDAEDDVIWGGVQPTQMTGYVTLAGSIPEYVHEEVYVNLTNLNTYKIYGTRLYEVNGYAAQICVPSGIYMISAGGMFTDNNYRFYLKPLQFQVKRGSSQTQVVTLADNYPELADEAYATYEDSKKDSVSDTLDAAEGAGIQTDENTSKDGFKDEPAGNLPNDSGRKAPLPWPAAVLLTIAFTGIPLAILCLIRKKTRPRKRGFYE